MSPSPFTPSLVSSAAVSSVALWLGLHGLAHQRAVAPSFPWPPDIAERLIGSLAHLTGGASPAATADDGGGSEPV
ncbi:hypothetical protein ACFWR9_32615 [Streptomyces sp. NPDC058534]|uniref:hypothetical protein n=1 Tax=Streptomyces sp. NPDC058534 TaxID=3346541 RepID=UPI00365DD08F